jgi:Zn-finger nucleic acid-binding protein
MFCPKCQNTLRERRRDDVMLDICPGCGGVWLDRGELEKLTASERSYYRRDDDDDDWDDDDGRRRERYEARGPVGYEERPRYDDRPRDDRQRYDDRQPRYDDRRYEGQPRKKRGGFLENIFGNFGEGGGMDD